MDAAAIFTVDHGDIVRALKESTALMKEGYEQAGRRLYDDAVATWNRAIDVLKEDEDDYLYGKLFVVESKIKTDIAWSYMLRGKYEDAGNQYSSAIYTISGGKSRLERKLADNKETYETAINLLTLGTFVASAVVLSNSGATPEGLQNYVNTAAPPWTSFPDPTVYLEGVTVLEGSLDHNVYRIPIIPTHGPLKRVGRVKMSSGNNRSSHCTGSLVGRRLVLTNNHCVHNDANGKPYHPSQLSFNLEKLQYELSFGVETFYTSAGHERSFDAQATQRWQDDWAILVLSLPPGDHSLGFLSIKPGLNDSNRRQHDGHIIIPGYSGDVNRGLFMTSDVGCSITRVQSNGQITHDCDGRGGSSGSPILTMRDGDWSVIGLHACGRELDKFGCGTRITHIAPEIARLRELYP